ncbi:N-acetyltransferase [Aquihabitans sp. G128]|uniref:GNAT family N-acetyltransferase n=1 Tax=Aquihabitans sp. G128 TaxID=2849779 RepID=UPI001C243FBA|nr:GNAT family N-acetyltransferase [Aquihabitans sp. G128]QXC61152.1 N-acetyltransferase [Aquihabitans sp. G128]
MESEHDQPTVRDNPDRQRYEVLLGDEVVGFAEHHPAGAGVEVFPHTVVTPAHEGKGLASVLVQHALDDVRARGLKVEPTCWYVARWIGRHPDYQDLLAQPA